MTIETLFRIFSYRVGGKYVHGGEMKEFFRFSIFSEITWYGITLSTTEGRV